MTSTEKLEQLTPDERAEQQVLLDEVIAAQTAFWDAMSSLESAVGFEINRDNEDWEGRTLEDVYEDATEDDEDDEESDDDAAH